MKLPVFYVYLQHKLAEHAQNNIISEEEIFYLFSHYNIPKKLRRYVLTELSDLKCLELKDGYWRVLNVQSTIKHYKTRVSKSNGIIKSLVRSNFFEY